MESSAILLDEIRTGSRPALEQLLERHLPALRAYVRLSTGPALRAQESQSDLVQSVCRELLADLSRFEYRGEPEFRAWMYQAAARKVASKARYWKRDMRDHVRREQYPDDDGSLCVCYATIASPSAIAASKELAERMEKAFEELPENYRRVVLLKRVAGLSTADLAAELGHGEGYTRVLLSRALARLATLLDL
jgi:RNA polymerase sigma factor (sigma-70 family)